MIKKKADQLMERIKVWFWSRNWRNLNWIVTHNTDGSGMTLFLSRWKHGRIVWSQGFRIDLLCFGSGEPVTKVDKANCRRMERMISQGVLKKNSDDSSLPSENDGKDF